MTDRNSESRTNCSSEGVSGARPAPSEVVACDLPELGQQSKSSRFVNEPPTNKDQRIRRVVRSADFVDVFSFSCQLTAEEV